MNRLAVFDCDGTLVDSQANICRALEDTFVLHRLDVPSRAAIRRIVGLSLVKAMQVLVPDTEDAHHHALAEDYKTIFAAMRSAGTLADEPLFDGILALLDTLDAEGWLFGVATGKSDRGLAHVLAAQGLTSRFLTLQTADRHPSKPHPSMIEQAMADAGASPERTVMIGDTSYDMLMARRAGARALGVGWGYHAPEDLHAAGADAVALEVPALAALMTV